MFFPEAERRGFHHPSPRGTYSSLESLILITRGPVILIFEIYCWLTPEQRSLAPMSPSWQSFVKHSPLLTIDVPNYVQTHTHTHTSNYTYESSTSAEITSATAGLCGPESGFVFPTVTLFGGTKPINSPNTQNTQRLHGPKSPH